MIVLVDYGLGNLRSVKKAFKIAGEEVIISFDKQIIEKADKLVLPGVGNFHNGMENLKKRDLISVLNKEVLIKKKPILGICLGMQLMTTHSEEGDVKGFNWIKAETKKFDINLKVPHIGWNSVKGSVNLLMKNLDKKSDFYFTHSYYVSSKELNRNFLYSEYEINFISGFKKDNICGVQFHPEKSHSSGIKLIKNFINL